MLPEDYLCDTCGQSVRFEFHVEPDIWEKATDAKDRNPEDSYDGGEGYLCLGCFTLKAASKGITSFSVDSITPIE